MTPTQTVFQVLSAVLSVLAIFQKQKWKMMLIYTIDNVIIALTYLAFGRIASMTICFVAAIRTAIFMIYSLKKIKPNFVWLIIFESAFIVSTILTWQDALDLMPLFALLAAGYGSWQDKQLVLRISYITNYLLYVVYQSIIGAYISMTVSIVSLVCTITCLIYYCILKKETPILELIFKKKKKEAAVTEDTEDIYQNVENDTENNDAIQQQKEKKYENKLVSRSHEKCT